MNAIKRSAMSLRTKLAIIALILFVFIDEGVFRVMHVSIHPNPIFVLIAVMANVILFGLHRISYYRRQCFLLGGMVDELCIEVKEERGLRNKYFRKASKMQNIIEMLDAHNIQVPRAILSNGSYIPGLVAMDEEQGLIFTGKAGTPQHGNPTLQERLNMFGPCDDFEGGDTYETYNSCKHCHHLHVDHEYKKSASN
jgi:hypothetical protein